MITAAEIMTRNVITVRPHITMQEASQILVAKAFSGVPVVDEHGRLVGVVTEFAMLAMAYDDSVRDHKVEQHMTRDVLSVEPHQPINEVVDLCVLHRVRRVPVTQNGQLVGLIARRDVLRALQSTKCMASAT